MPAYRVDLPDGTAYKVESEHDLTDEQVHAALGFKAPEQPQSSAPGAFARGVGSKAGRGAGALAGALYGAAALSEFGPPGMAIGGIGGAILGGAGGEAVQEGVQGPQYTEALKQQVAVDQQQHEGWSNTGGMLADLPSAFVAPESKLLGIGGKVVNAAIAGGVMSGGEAGGGAVSGENTIGQIPGKVFQGGVTFAPSGFIPGAGNAAGEIAGNAYKYLGRPLADAATLGVSNVAYDAAQGDNAGFAGFVDQTQKNIIPFLAVNAAAGLLHGHAKPLEGVKENGTVPHENVPTPEQQASNPQNSEESPVSSVGNAQKAEPIQPVAAVAGSDPIAGLSGNGEVRSTDVLGMPDKGVSAASSGHSGDAGALPGNMLDPGVTGGEGAVIPPPADGGGAGGEVGGQPSREEPVNGGDGQGTSSDGKGVGGEAAPQPQPGPVAPGGETLPIKNSVTNRLREAAGFKPIEPGEPRTRASADAEARAVVAKDPEAAAKLYADLHANPRSPDYLETKILGHSLGELSKTFDATNKEVNDAYESGDKGRQAAAIDAHAKILSRVDEETALYNKVGRIQSHGFMARQGIDGLIGDEKGVRPLALELQASRARKGGVPLTPKEVKSITKEHEAYTRERAKVAAKIQEGREAEDVKYVAMLTAEVKAEMRTNPEEAARIRVGGLSARLPVARKLLPDIPGAIKPRTGDIKTDSKLPSDIAQHALHGIGVLERVWNIALPSAKLAIKKATGKDFGKYDPAGRAVHVGEKQTIHTAIHEVAHWLDHSLGGRDYASRQAAGTAKELASRMTQSDGMRAARQTLARSDISPFLRAHLNYLLKPEEMFARAVEHATAKLGNLPEPQYDPITNLYAKLTSAETDAIVPHVKAALERFERPTETGRSEPDASTNPERAANESVAANADGDSARNSATGLAGEEVGIQEARSAADPEEDKTKLDGKRIKELYKAHIKANLEKPLGRAELEKRAVTDAQKIWPDASPREIRDAFSDYMKVSYPSKDVLKAQQAEMRTQSKLISRLEDLDAGVTRRFGLQRRPLSDESRSLTRQIRDKMRALGIRVAGPESLKGTRDAIVARLKNSITDNMAIIEGRMKPKTPKEKFAYDADMEKLRKHNAELNAYILDLTGPSKEGEWNQQREKAYRAAEAYYKKRAAAGDLERRKGGSKYEPNEKTKAAQADALKAKEQWEALREASGIIGKEKLEAYKKRLQRSIDENNRKVATGDFYKKSPEEMKIDRETQDLQYKQVQSRWRLERAKKEAEMSNRSDAQKIADTAVGWRRGFLLSGYHVLAKLGAAALARHAVTPVDELAGSVLSRLSPTLAKVASKAPREGSGFQANVEAKAITDGVNAMLKHAGDIMRTGLTPSDAHSGKNDLHDLEHYGGKSVIELFGHLHAFLKSSAKEAEFSRSFQKRVAHEISQGRDPTDPFIQTKLMVESYKDAKRAVFQQQNFVSQSWKNTLRMLESSKLAPRAGKVAATVGRILIPISTVPTNFIGEAINRTPVGLIRGAMELRGAIKKGLDTLNADDADKIMRHLKQGSVGTGLMLLGYLAPQIAGGYFQAGQKRKESDLHPGDIGFKGSHLIMHNSAAEVITMGATVRKVADHMLQGHPEGFVKGLAQSYLGLASQMPFIRTPSDVANVVTGKPSDQSRTMGNLVQGLAVPRGVAEIAQDTDSVASRKMKTVPDYLKGSIPGLRQTLPVRSVH